MKHSANYDTVKKLGEFIFFPDGKRLKASFKSSTSAVFNLANRAFYIEGQVFKDDYNVGDYFCRECEPNSIYMIATVISEPLAEDLVYLYAMQCNANITVMRYKGRKSDENGDIRDVFENVYTEIPVYRDFTTRSGKQTNDGLMDQGIYSMILSHKYMLAERDRVIMKMNIGGEFRDKAYYVESVGCAVIYENGGIDTVQLSVDTRS